MQRDYTKGRYIVREYKGGSLFDTWRSDDAPAVLSHTCRGHHGVDRIVIADSKTPNLIEWKHTETGWDREARLMTPEEREVINAMGEYQQYLGRDAENYEALILDQVADENLPDFAAAVKAGGERTADYWRWLLNMWGTSNPEPQPKQLELPGEVVDQVLESLEVDISRLESVAAGELVEEDLTPEAAATYAQRKREALELIKKQIAS